MASSTDNTDAAALTGSMLEEKQRELKAAKRPDMSGGILRSGAGAIAGFTTGVSAVIAGAISHGFYALMRVMEKNPDLIERANKISEQAQHSPSKGLADELKGVLKELGGHVDKALITEQSLGKTIVKNSGSWVLGLTAAGAGLGVLWQMKVRNQKVVAAEKDVAQLQKIKDSWQERINAPEEKSAETAR